METLEWRAERVCHKAWPALREVELDDWMLRLAPGISRRANSLNPSRPEAVQVDETIAAAAPYFDEASLPMLFRVPTLLDPAVDRRLDALGFTAEGETTTLFGDIDNVGSSVFAPDIECMAAPDAAWLTAMARLQEYEPPRAATFRRIIVTLAIPAAFMRLSRDNEPAALAYGAVDCGLLCCEMVITAPEHRGRGYATRMMQALFAWAASQGVEGVCLQVVSDNHSALALYRGLGLTRELYRYHYRRAAA